jgi:hypothetical protein
MQTSFTKSGSEWAVRVWGTPLEIARLSAGDDVIVSKRDGSAQTVKIGSTITSTHGGRATIFEIVKQAKQQAQPKVTLPLVEDGRYAVCLGGQWLLYRVWRGTRDPSVQHVYSVQGTEKGVRVYGTEERDALNAIVQDPAEAARAFGYRTGSCSRCGKELDVNLTRFMGIGPVCVKHFMEDEARYELLAESRDLLRQVGIDPADCNDDLAPAFHIKHKIEFARYERQQETAAFMVDVA